MSALHEKIANDIPQIKRGMVWCRTCGHSQRVDGAECLRHGWPKCCGFTMTIDAPDVPQQESKEARDGTE